MRVVRSAPRLFWIMLLLIFQMFEVYFLWPSAPAGGATERIAHVNAQAEEAQTFQSRLPVTVIEALNEKWMRSEHALPDLSECGDACQCDKDKSDGKSAVARTVNQIEHRDGTTTRVSLKWSPDDTGASVQCVFGDRIVKGNLIDAHSGDSAAQQACAATAAATAFSPLTSSQFMQISCVVPPRFHLVQPGESLYAIALMHGLSHTM
jgi:hypothetical protein